jgi:hypothetical protein
MAAADADTLVVVSSDHGTVAFRSVLHINDLLADEGLVRRAGSGYDLRRSEAFYHPSDCGLVLLRPGVERGRALSRLVTALDRCRDQHSADIRMIEGRHGDPFLAFLYPGADVYFSGRAPKGGRPVLDSKDRGGHHLCPLSPTPWISAVLGLWSPREGRIGELVPPIPDSNAGMKGFLLEALGVL